MMAKKGIHKLGILGISLTLLTSQIAFGAGDGEIPAEEPMTPEKQGYDDATSTNGELDEIEAVASDDEEEAALPDENEAGFGDGGEPMPGASSTGEQR